MDVDAMNDEGLIELRERVERLERQVAELRASGARVEQVAVPPPPPRVVKAAALPSLAQMRPEASMEDRIGSQWFSRIGVLALLMAMALFLKLAIDKHWLGPVGRVVCGLLGGAGIVVWSEWFRRKGVTAFSYALKAVGSGVLYLSLWAAFQLYHLLPDWAALGAMVLVTAWNAYLAWSQEAELLAVYALAGGMATPLLLSTGANHEVFLFTYLLALGLATVALVRLKPWPRLLLGVFPGTVAYFIGWYARFYRAEELGVTAVFLGLFGLVFGSVAVGARAEGQLRQIAMPFGNAVFVALGLYSVVQDAGHHGWLPWVMLGLAAVYLGAMRLPQSAVVAAVHLSLAVVLLTVAIPLKASEHWITVAWLVEGAALLWGAARVGDGQVQSGQGRVLRWLACGALGLGFAGVMTAAWWFGSVHAAFWNWRFGTGVVGGAAFGAAVWLGLREHKEGEVEASGSPEWLEIAAVSVVAFNLVVVCAGVREIASFWGQDAGLQKALAVSAYLMAYGAAVLAVGFWKRRAFVRWQGLALLVFTIAKTFLYDMRSLSEGYRVASFLALGVLLMGVSFAYQKDWLGLRPGPEGEAQP